MMTAGFGNLSEGEGGTWLTNDRIFMGAVFAPDSADSNNDVSIFGGGVRGRAASGAWRFPLVAISEKEM